jgi:chemotaxis protein histidine kinase CheA
MREVFGIGAQESESSRPVAVIVRDNQRRGALLIDELLGQQQVVIKPLDRGVGTVPGVSGGAVIGDGTISLIVDVPSLLDLAARKDEATPVYEGAGA